VSLIEQIPPTRAAFFYESSPVRQAESQSSWASSFSGSATLRTPFLFFNNGPLVFKNSLISESEVPKLLGYFGVWPSSSLLQLKRASPRFRTQGRSLPHLQRSPSSFADLDGISLHTQPICWFAEPSAPEVRLPPPALGFSGLSFFFCRPAVTL